MDRDATFINNKEYIELETISINDNEYAYMINPEDEEDFTVRKVIFEEDKKVYAPLKDREEFEKALMYFVKKHSNLLKDEQWIILFY